MTSEVKTDVLIIGSGGAGLRAALAAKIQGVDVVVINKSGGNSTLMAAGNFSAVQPSSDNEDTLESHYDDTIKSGMGINDPKLVKILVENAQKEITNLQEWGVKFHQLESGKPRLFNSGGHSYPRSVRCVTGNSHQVYKVLYSKAKETGVRIISNVYVTNLICIEKKIRGAVGINSHGEAVVFRSNSVVLATGGLGSIYEHTTNPSGITGEGYILGIEAGAVLKDMEFIQFLPTTVISPPGLKGLVISDIVRGEGAILINSKLERFMSKYSPEKKELDSRAVVARSIYQEIVDGRGTKNGGVYLDCRNACRDNVLKSLTHAQRFLSLGLDPSEKFIEVAPSAHFCCGGIRIDERCFTGVEGMWAAGEVTSGVHGANRLGANALTEYLVFGSIAGDNAAKSAKKHPQKISVSIVQKYLAELRISETDSILDCKMNGELREIEDNLKQIMWKSAGITRNECSLNKGIKQIDELKNHLELIYEGKDLSKQFLFWHRLKKELKLAEAILLSAQLRRESRGSHYRDDYPALNNDLEANIEVNIKNRSHLCVEFQDVSSVKNSEIEFELERYHAQATRFSD